MNYQEMIRAEMDFQRRRLYKRLKKSDGRLIVEYWAGAKQFLNSVPGINWEKQGSRILIKGENVKMKSFKEILNEVVRIETNKYEASHGKKPKGTGSWAFIVEGKTEFAPGSMSFADAKKWAKKEFSDKRSIEVGP